MNSLRQRDLGLACRSPLNADVFLAAVGIVAKSPGMSGIAEESGLGRESLYRALTPGAKPRCDTVPKVLQSPGIKLSVSAA